MSTYNTARVLGLKKYGLAEGCRADFVVLDAITPSAAIVDQAQKLYVFKSGQLVFQNCSTKVPL